MNDSQKYELLELYRIHTELADRVSQRREGANRLFGSLLVGLILFVGIFIRFGSNEASLEMIFIFTGILGVVLSLSWIVVIQSYRQLNTYKFMVLHELEKELSFAFFKKEWEYALKGNIWSRYWKLTVVETILPGIFFVYSFLFMIIGLCQVV